MKHSLSKNIRVIFFLLFITSLVRLSWLVRADTGTCGGQMITLPFTDVTAGNVFFCSIAEAFFSGLTNGTSGTTYSPGNPVPREQMAAFVTRTMDQSLKRGSRRASLKQWWTPTGVLDLALTTVGSVPELVESDGADLWVPNFISGTVSRVRGSDGKLVETWTGATEAGGVVVATGRVFIAGGSTPGALYQIDPKQPAGPVAFLTNVGDSPQGIAFDGARVWTADSGSPGSVSIVTLSPAGVTTVSTGFVHPVGILFDGTNIWVTDSDNMIKRLDSNGNILQSVPVGDNPHTPVFDGTNIWVPNNNSNSVTVVRAATGTVLATLSGNGLNGPDVGAFDGERILITNQSGNSVSLWMGADLTPLGSFSTGASSQPFGACSDGLNFWIALSGTGKLARF
jgi:hypothetical protein